MHPSLRTHPVAGLQEQEVTDDEVGDIHRPRDPVTHHACRRRQQGSQPLGRAVCSVLLPEREDPVEDDDDDDGRRERRHAAQQGESGSDPEQEG